MNDVSEEKSTAIDGYGPGACEGRIHAAYLLSATKYLKEIPSNALRCHWNILLADIMNMKGLVRSSQEFEKLGVCQYCQTPWTDGNYHVKVVPKRKRKKKFRKLLRRVEEQKELSRIQMSLFNSLHLGPSVVINCKICSKSSRFKIPVNRNKEMVVPGLEIGLQDCQELIKSQTKKKKKKKKKKPKKKTGNTPSFNVDSTTEVQDKNECYFKDIKMENTDDDIIIVHEKLEKNLKSNAIPIKRKLDDDDILELLPESVVIKKSKEDGWIENPLEIKPLGVSARQSGQFNTVNNDYIPLHTFKPKAEVNVSSKKSQQNQGKQKKKSKNKVVSINLPQGRKKKNNLNRWKRLIADQEAKATKTCSLQDFLSAL